jgi:branched-chain amino acid transport system substrate-binding protein
MTILPKKNIGGRLTRGEWATPRLLMIQYQNIQGNNLDQYRTSGKAVILYPPEYKDGELQHPFFQ